MIETKPQSMNQDYSEVHLQGNTSQQAPASTRENLKSRTRTNRKALQEFCDVPDGEWKERARWASDHQDEQDFFE